MHAEFEFRLLNMHGYGFIRGWGLGGGGGGATLLLPSKL